MSHLDRDHRAVPSRQGDADGGGERLNGHPFGFVLPTVGVPGVKVEQHSQPVLLMACNSTVAIGEYLLKARLLPSITEQSGNDFFRPWALLGHPLLNATLTMALLPAITLLPWPKPARLGLAALLFTAALAFGGRSALVFGTLIYGAAVAVVLFRKTVRSGFTYFELTGGGLAFALGASALALVVAFTGLGERIFGNLIWDQSANVRAEVWRAFDYLRGADWWIGMAPTQIDKVALAMGLDPKFEAIENFWIYMYLQFGAIGFVPFIVGLFSLIALMLKTATPAMRAAVVMFFLVASTANSLSSKSVSLTLVALVSIGSLGHTRKRGFATFLDPRGGRAPQGGVLGAPTRQPSRSARASPTTTGRPPDWNPSPMSKLRVAR